LTETTASEGIGGDGVFSPVPRQQLQRLVPAPGRADLTGARVGFVWDYLFAGPQVFDTLAEQLGADFSGVEAVGYETFGDIHGRHEEQVLADLPELLRTHNIDVAVVGIGA
jgi:hypothetical protein